MSRVHAPRASLPSEDRAFIALQKAADKLALQAEQLLKSNGLTGAQYNVLRILRGAEPKGATCSQIAERMINHDPDITRLLDRMETRGFITRDRIKEDRRVVMVRITAAGLELVSRIDRPLRAFLKARVGKLGQPALAELIGHLEQIREHFQTEKE